QLLVRALPRLERARELIVQFTELKAQRQAKLARSLDPLRIVAEEFEHLRFGAQVGFGIAGEQRPGAIERDPEPDGVQDITQGFALGLVKQRAGTGYYL